MEELFHQSLCARSCRRTGLMPSFAHLNSKIFSQLGLGTNGTLT